MSRLWKHCRPLYDLPDSSSMVFGVVHAIDRAACERACDFASFTTAEVAEAFQYTKGICPSRQTDIAAAHAMYYVHLAQETYRKNGLYLEKDNYNVKCLIDRMKF
jgi:hypothetical protein